MSYLARAAILVGPFATSVERLGEAVGIMFSLDLAARQLMLTPSGLGDGTSAGPSFQVPFVT